MLGLRKKCAEKKQIKGEKVSEESSDTKENATVKMRRRQVSYYTSYG